MPRSAAWLALRSFETEPKCLMMSSRTESGSLPTWDRMRNPRGSAGSSRSGKPSSRADQTWVLQLGPGHPPKLIDGLGDGVAPQRTEIVLKDRPLGEVDPGHQVVELKGDDPAVLAEGVRPGLDHLAETVEQLGALENGHRRTVGGEPGDFETGETHVRVVETAPQPVEALQLLVDVGGDLGGGCQLDLLAVVEESGHPPPLADGNHRLPGLGGHALGGSMPGAGLIGGERAVGDEVDRAAP